ncbi:MAG: dinitrogenase iron-molybdenum cofactor [Clostridiaceae bacterium]|jgi:predicted Fe-Mo cluster-binding NifX family protein|nr:dinitrogenase iron-molybdenum cofactor [Clostridiaceae bacterium]
MKKIAIASDGGAVSGHFGHCEGFFVYETEGVEILRKSFIANPGHQPGLLPRLMQEAGAHVVIAGGMGGGAIELFNAAAIDVVTGAAGSVDDVVRSWLEGKLVSDGSTCHEHKHADDCGDH